LAGGGNTRRNGLDVNTVKVRNPAAIQACTASARALRVAGRPCPNRATAAPKPASIRIHNSIDPSWFPHTPVILYSIGFAECEFSTTFTTVKSETT
jgi:hypothetical protein